MTVNGKTYADLWLEDARLVMLRELAKMPDGRLNQTLMAATLDAFGYRWTKAAVAAQMRGLAELGAAALEIVKDDKGGDFLILAISREGVEHLERRAFIDGVAKPSLGV